MPEYNFVIETPPVQARPTVVTVTCGESSTDMRQVMSDNTFSSCYAVVGEWLPTQEWRRPLKSQAKGFLGAPSLPYDQMLELVKEQVQLWETRRLIQEKISALEMKTD